ncbi:MAG TPA: type II toxin-antitoxin system VapC family toxin [Rhizomicrobium sp.]|nr:type II toxin-antitoxin system VapC family toxin [Rhizomicrobium sp.]
MTGGKVIDASAAAAVVFLESKATDIDRRIAGWKLLAPAILTFEMMNVCVKKMRAHPDQRAAILIGFRTYQRAEIELRDVDQPGVIDIADRLKLSAYDASYLWLARHLGAELVTLDARLEKAVVKAT